MIREKLNTKGKPLNRLTSNKSDIKGGVNMKKGESCSKVGHFTAKQTTKLNKVFEKGDSIKFIKTLQSELGKNGFYNRLFR